MQLLGFFDVKYQNNSYWRNEYMGYMPISYIKMPSLANRK